MIQYVVMEHDHVPQIARLEKVCFSDPWSESSILSELSNPLSHWLVAMDGDRVAGYIGSQAVLDSADIMNVAVAPEYRREGIGETLIALLERSLAEIGVNTLLLEVRISNTAAIRLYGKCGFTQVGVRKNYYLKPKEDALIFRKEWQI